MKKKPASKSAFFNQRVLIGFSFCLIGLVLALMAFAALPGGNALARQEMKAAPAVAQQRTAVSEATATHVSATAFVEEEVDSPSIILPNAKDPVQPDEVRATFVVNTIADTADAVAGDGACADSTGACSLRAAISEANALAGPDTITLGAVVYTTTLVAANEDLNAGGDYDIRSDITINGVSAATTILQANAAPNTATEKVLHITTATATAVTINNVTIRHGHSTVNTLGGGVRIDNAANVVNINNSIITANRVTNPVNAFAGGLGITAGSVTLTGCTISGNSAVSTGTAAANNGFAGGIYNQQATVNLVNSTLTGNFASSFHGGIRNLASTTAVAITNVTNSTISNNTAQGQNTLGGPGEGGGLVNIAGAGFASTMNVTASTINGNAAQVLGAPGAGTAGGGIENFSVAAGPAITNVTNSTVSGNTAADGGGSYSDGAVATVNINYSTIASNTATRGGGLFQDVTAGGVTNLKSSIVADNTASTAGPNIFGTITSQNYNHIEDPAGGTFAAMANDVVAGDPALGGLANNGGPTFTHLPGGASIILNTIPAGTNECGTTVAVDQRALGRPSGAGCDKGSVEVQGGASPTPSATVSPTATATATVAPSATPSASPSASCPPSSATFPGTGAGAIPDPTPPATAQNCVAAPRVISFAVSGITGNLTGASVNMNVAHTFVGDLSVTLAAPGGAPSLVIYRFTGATTATGFGFAGDLLAANLYNFADSAATNWWTAAGGASVAAGNYRTTQSGGAAQVNPAPVTSLNAIFAGLTPAQANGTWTLTFLDCAATDTGSVSGANLTLTSAAGPGCPSPTPSPSASPSPSGTPSPSPSVSPGEAAP